MKRCSSGSVKANWMKEFISDYFTFDEVVEAYQKAFDKKIQKKGIVVYK